MEYQIRWDQGAFRRYQEFKLKHPERLDLLDARLDALRGFPPRRWYQLRNTDGMIRFLMDNDQFVIVNGYADEGERTVYITHFSSRQERSRSHG